MLGCCIIVPWVVLMVTMSWATDARAQISNAERGSVLIQNARVIDGLGLEPVIGQDVKVVDGVIVAIGRGLENTESLRTLDATGLTMLPGLIDCHTHLRAVPGAIIRNDSSEELRAQRELQLRAYVAAGVTTVLDAAMPEAAFGEMREIAKRSVIPTVLGLAPFITPPGGYFGRPDIRSDTYKDVWVPVDNVETLVAHFARAKPLDPVGVKVTVESGFGPFDVWPIFDDAMLTAIKREAAKAELPVYVHSMSEKEYRHALKLSPYAFVHVGFGEETPSDQLIQDIKNSHAYVTSTLGPYGMMLLMWQRDQLKAPWIKRLVPERQLKTADDEEARRTVIGGMAVLNSPPWIPDFLARWSAGWFLDKEIVGRMIASSMRAVKKMYEAGIPIVMGSDAGNWPLFTTFFHGVGTILEMKLLQDAGIPNGEVIVAATSRAAKMLGQEGTLGSIEVGKTGDVILLTGDPLEDMSSLRELSWVVKNGVTKRPAAWLHD